ncbi:phosphatidylserine decarboxylase [Cymbomonas tetramitiformis]|uniref:Phosphatidylserine decarboxylase n=1 Tax=Cymbomonas tetramitiformis TaxID=36881 RepID=A0AAE0G1R6_9CHLO|nr:phosphatidylserine decarboxylase [Cymbomonas tetramitiformis]
MSSNAMSNGSFDASASPTTCMCCSSNNNLTLSESGFERQDTYNHINRVGGNSINKDKSEMLGIITLTVGKLHNFHFPNESTAQDTAAKRKATPLRSVRRIARTINTTVSFGKQTFKTTPKKADKDVSWDDSCHIWVEPSQSTSQMLVSIFEEHKFVNNSFVGGSLVDVEPLTSGRTHTLELTLDLVPQSELSRKSDSDFSPNSVGRFFVIATIRRREELGQVFWQTMLRSVGSLDGGVDLAGFRDILAVVMSMQPSRGAHAARSPEVEESNRQCIQGGASSCYGLVPGQSKTLPPESQVLELQAASKAGWLFQELGLDQNKRVDISELSQGLATLPDLVANYTLYSWSIDTWQPQAEKDGTSGKHKTMQGGFLTTSHASAGYAVTPYAWYPPFLNYNPRKHWTLLLLLLKIPSLPPTTPLSIRSAALSRPLGPQLLVVVVDGGQVGLYASGSHHSTAQPQARLGSNAPSAASSRRGPSKSLEEGRRCSRASGRRPPPLDWARSGCMALMARSLSALHAAPSTGRRAPCPTRGCPAPNPPTAEHSGGFILDPQVLLVLLIVTGVADVAVIGVADEAVIDVADVAVWLTWLWLIDVAVIGVADVAVIDVAVIGLADVAVADVAVIGVADVAVIGVADVAVSGVAADLPRRCHHAGVPYHRGATSFCHSAFIPQLAGEYSPQASEWLGIQKYHTYNDPFILVKERGSGMLVEEVISLGINLSMRTLYQTKTGRAMLMLPSTPLLMREMSVKIGHQKDRPSSTEEIPGFIKHFAINTSEILEPIESFKSFNDFFSRHLKPDMRPIHRAEQPQHAVQPADARVSAFEDVDSAKRLWIKSKAFTLEGLLGDRQLAEAFEGGSLLISRLAPQDYHRFHSPVDGKVVSLSPLLGTQYWTVNPIAINSPTPVFTENVRRVAVIESPQFGKVAFVCIGATMVGTIEFSNLKEGATLTRGLDLGTFKFGGSTCVTVFQKDAILLDSDLGAVPIKNPASRCLAQRFSAPQGAAPIENPDSRRLAQWFSAPQGAVPIRNPVSWRLAQWFSVPRVQLPPETQSVSTLRSGSSVRHRVRFPSETRSVGALRGGSVRHRVRFPSGTRSVGTLRGGSVRHRVRFPSGTWSVGVLRSSALPEQYVHNAQWEVNYDQMTVGSFAMALVVESESDKFAFRVQLKRGEWSEPLYLVKVEGRIPAQHELKYIYVVYI